jgi:hypothetical protein
MAPTGRTLEAVLGDGSRETIHLDDHLRWLEALAAAFERHEPFTLEYGSGGTSGNIAGFSIAAFRYWRLMVRQPDRSA